jgi:hypothetical protein
MKDSADATSVTTQSLVAGKSTDDSAAEARNASLSRARIAMMIDVST